MAVTTFVPRAGRLVMVSSFDVYRAYARLIGTESGPADPLALHEDSPVRTSLYPYRAQEAKGNHLADRYDKLLAENVLRRVSGLCWTILRLPKIYGAEDNRDLATVYGFGGQPEWRWA